MSKYKQCIKYNVANHVKDRTRTLSCVWVKRWIWRGKM